MPTLNIGDRKVTVDESFLSLAPEQQQAAVEEIAAAFQKPSTATDVAKSFGSGVVRGVTSIVGTGGDISKAAGAGIDRLAEAGVPVEQARSDMLEAMPQWLRKFHETKSTPIGTAEINATVDKAANAPVTSYQPKTTAGKYARTVGEFAPGLIGGGGVAGIGRRAVTQVLAPGIGSEAAGQLTEGTKFEPYARIAGAVAGSMLPTMVSRAITPLPTDATRNAAVESLRREGVTDITAGQATGRKPLQYLEAERGRGSGLMDSQAEQFTAAALRRAGENAVRATPEVVDRAFTRIGNQFDDLASRNFASLDVQFANDLRNTVDDYRNLVAAPNRAPVIDNFVSEIANAGRTHGNLPGDVYQSLRSRMERAARGLGNNPEAMHAVREMREALDGAMERSIATANPADLGAWQEARRQYRNMLVIERAATGAGEGAAAGLISPAKLREATVNTHGRRNYARGRGDFADLARSGVAVMSPLPNSGTPGRMAAQNLGTGASSVVGALLGATGGTAIMPGVGSSLGAAAGAMAGALVPRMVGRAATSRAGRAYLGNQVMTPLQLDPARAAVINALVASRAQPAAQPRQ